MRKTFYDYCMERGNLELLQQWDVERNGNPQDFSYGSRRKVWWHCPKGHAWTAALYTRTSGSGCPYCAGRRVVPGETDLASQFPNLARQWQREKNLPLTPEEVSVGSHQKVWWRCGKGHEWQAIVKSRTGGADCPYCSNHTLLPGENDLGSTHPRLAAQWDAEKNTGLTPRDLTAGSRKKVWWHCAKGHQWQAMVASRTRGAGCPVCAGKQVVPQENDLGSCFPAIAAQWHFGKNGTLTPETCSPASNRRVWWLCPQGHSYQAAVSARTVNGSGCPYCAGRKVLEGFNDLATLEPKISDEWHSSLNGSLTAAMVTVGSRRKVWWQCPLGHVWKAVVYSRTGPKRTGCPVCAGRTAGARQQRYGALLAETSQSTAAAVFEK